jgi:hypothetical protein
MVVGLLKGADHFLIRAGWSYAGDFRQKNKRGLWHACEQGGRTKPPRQTRLIRGLSLSQSFFDILAAPADGAS